MCKGFGALVLVGFLFHTGASIRCWECNSHFDPNCGDPFKSHTIPLVDCSQRFLRQDPTASASICRKIEQKVRGETRIIRSCGFLEPQEAGSCTMRAGTHMVFMHYCQCAGEGCNSAPRASSMPLLLMLPLMMMMIRRFS